MSTLRPERVRFGAFEFDLSTGELRSIEAPDPSSPDSNSKVVLREQVFRVLQMLVEREGKIVTREEIKSSLWANDTFVDFNQSINATMKALRRALGDSADSPRYIETWGRRGYRLMLTIEYREAAPATSLETHPKQQEQCAIEERYNAARVQLQVKPHWRRAAAMLVSIVVLAGAGFMPRLPSAMDFDAMPLL